MKIQEVSSLLDISPSTLRYYEEIGLITVPRKGNQRDYHQNHIEQIQFIQCMKRTGMALSSILQYIHLYQVGDHASTQKRIQLLKDQKKDVEKEIQNLKESLDFLNQKIQYVRCEGKNKK